MISTKINQQVAGLDEVIYSNDTDFSKSGLKKTSLIRVARVAVVEVNLLLGSIGAIDSNRLDRVKENLANWLKPQ